MNPSRHSFANVTFAVLLSLATLLGVAVSRGAEDERHDVVVYGGTPAGIAAAVQAGRMGATVLLVEPTGHVGGLTTSGLSHVDYRTYESLTGFYLEFTNRVDAYYLREYGADSPQHRDCRRGTHGEPHVNELAFEVLLAETPGVAVARNLRLSDVATAPRTSDGPRTLSTATFLANDGAERTVGAAVFVDATYEGDLMARAGVPYAVGREGRDEFGESLAPEGPDDQLQGYNFRAIMTQVPENRVPVEQPEKYDRGKFAGVLELFADGRLEHAFGVSYEGTGKSVFKAQIPRLPNGKVDINDVSGGAVRLSLPGEQLAWPDGDEAARRVVAQRHRDWQVGLLWFLQHDEAVPETIREEALSWGWAADEFVDNGHFPWQLYVREARRMKHGQGSIAGVGPRSPMSPSYTFTQRDVAASTDGVRAVFQPDAIAMGDYGPNCHGTGHEGPYFGGKHVGEFYYTVAPYQVPYGCLFSPRVTNLLVPVACASSHVGFCALRLEPIWTSLGQAAGIAATLAPRIPYGAVAAVAAVESAEIRRHLHAAGAATIYVADVPPGHELFQAVQWLGSLGGLHGLQPPDGRAYGSRGEREVGQYHEAFPGHAFEPDKPLTPDVRELWTKAVINHRARALGRELSPERSTELSDRIATLLAEEGLTRGAAVEILYRAGRTDVAP